ncbi:ATP-binding cassette domain-containing protein [Marinihelvus fidelis]|uniref:ATP-binding cassette domain-containing protein n=2 Tax=Marinihelvus fidelis TaxID=2613842 RepID=A0A5N0TFM9_9GAMM|nr:ATP-binding cassette domain-containing protein [Marinihelvus fidelis]
MPHPPVNIEALGHAYGRGELRKQVLEDISLEIPEGEIVIVTGPSGSGKTTLLTLVGALRSAQQGSLKVLGEELRDARPATLERVRRRIGFIFQQHNLLAALTAVQNVELGARVSGTRSAGERTKAARAMLEQVGMAAHLHHRPDALSGGQRQRVAIARALVGRPAMLLADEPTASLDSHSGREVVDLMQQLAREEGTTILLVTHDNRILDIADRIVHLEDGRLQTYTESVIAENRRMMDTLAHNMNRRDMDAVIEGLDERGFRNLLENITAESQQFIDATARAGDRAYASLLRRGLFAFTRKLAAMLNADRASLFLVEGDLLRLVVADNLDQLGTVTVPVGKGIVGAVAASGNAIRVADAYEDQRFNREIDRQTGYRTRSILSLPVRDHEGNVFAVAQLLNRRDGAPFDANDEDRFSEFMASIGVIFESFKLLSDTTGTTEGFRS